MTIYIYIYSDIVMIVNSDDIYIYSNNIYIYIYSNKLVTTNFLSLSLFIYIYIYIYIYSSGLWEFTYIVNESYPSLYQLLLGWNE